MPQPFHRALIFFLLLPALLGGCVSPQDEAAATVREYLQGFVEHDSNQVSNLSCGEWELDALTEVDSFQLVEVSLEDVECLVIDEVDNGYEVQCGGAIVTTYNNEQSRIELGERVYRVAIENGDLFVCGYR